MKRRDFLKFPILLAAGAGMTQEPPVQNYAPIPPPLPKRPTPADLFPLTPEEEKLLPALKHFTRSKEFFVPFSFKDPVAKNTALVGAGFNLNAAGKEHDGTFEYNGRKPLDPSAETLWKISGVSEDLATLRQHALPNSTARKYLKGYIVQMDQKARISEASAEALFDISARQAMYNASSHLRHWNKFTPYQKIAFSDMVYQMGSERFSEFKYMLGKANQENVPSQADWKMVQNFARGGKWLTSYPHRAPDVVDMMNPHYRAPKELSALIPPELLPPAAPAFVRGNASVRPHR